MPRKSRKSKKLSMKITRYKTAEKLARTPDGKRLPSIKMTATREIIMASDPTDAFNCVIKNMFRERGFYSCHADAYYVTFNNPVDDKRYSYVMPRGGLANLLAFDAIGERAEEKFPGTDDASLEKRADYINKEKAEFPLFTVQFHDGFRVNIEKRPRRTVKVDENGNPIPRPYNRRPPLQVVHRCKRRFHGVRAIMVSDGTVVRGQAASIRRKAAAKRKGKRAA
jgi:hypothetical protein